jgi:hypothetical protein
VLRGGDATPDAVVLEQRFDQRSQGAKLSNELLGFGWHLVPEGSQDTGDDDVDGLQQNIVDTERAEVGRVELGGCKGFGVSFAGEEGTCCVARLISAMFSVTSVCNASCTPRVHQKQNRKSAAKTQPGSARQQLKVICRILQPCTGAARAQR